MNKIKMAALIFLFFIFGQSIAQDAKVDSLKSLLRKTEGIEKVDLLNRIADLTELSKSKEKEKVSREALLEATKLNYISGIAEAKANLGNSLSELENYSEAFKYLLSAYKIFSHLTREQQVGKVLHFLGKNYYYLGEIDSAIFYYHKSLVIRKRFNETQNTAQLYMNIGLLHWSRGKFKDAINYFEKGLRLREKLKNDKLVSNSLNSLGSGYFKLGNFSKAMDYFQKSLILRDKSNDSLGKVISWNNIGTIYQKLELFDNAEEYFRMGLRLAEKTNYKFGKTYSLYNFGLLYLGKGKLEKSLKYFEDSFELAKTMYSQNLRTLILNYIGLIFEKRGNYTKAENYYNKGLAIAQKDKDKFSESVLYQGLSRIYLAGNQIQKAEKILEKGQMFALENNVNELLKDNYDIYSRIYAKKNDRLKSLEYFKLSSEFKDSLLSSSGNNLANILLKFEISKTESEKEVLRKQKKIIEQEKDYQQALKNFFLIVVILVIILGFAILFNYVFKLKAAKIIKSQKNDLEELNKKLSEQNEELTVINKHKDQLFSMIAHDLKSPFQALLGNSEMLTSEIETMTQEQIKECSGCINDSGKKIFNLMHNLLDWARQQLGKIEFNPVNFELNLLIDEAFSLYEHIIDSKHLKIIKNYNKKISVYADKEMINSVVRNLLSNAIKFSYENGVIEIEVKAGAEVIFSVKDDGEGMEKELADKIFNVDYLVSKPGTKREMGTGLGLNLCKDFVEKNQGAIWLESEFGKGSKFSFAIPSAKQ